MARLLYSARLGFDTLHFTADLDQASAQINIVDSARGDATPTQYQTSDARHRTRDALRLALTACGHDYYVDPSSDDSPEEQLTALVDGAHIRVTALAADESECAA
jgi:hypothetical protein